MNPHSNGAWRKRVAPSVPLKLDLAEEGGGRLKLDLELVFDFNAIAAVETETGTNVLTGDIWQNLNGTSLSVLFWAALRARQPGLAGAEGLEIVRSYIDVSNAAQITLAVQESFLVFLAPEARERLRAVNPPLPAATPEANPPAGAISGLSPAMTSASAATNSAN